MIFNLLIILIIGINFIQGFQPYIPNIPTVLSDQYVSSFKYNKQYLNLEEIEIFAYYKQKDFTYQPFIQANKNGQLLGEPILLGQENIRYKNSSGLQLIKTGKHKFVVLFTISDNSQTTIFDTHYKQSIQMVEFSNFDLKYNYKQSKTITIAESSDGENGFSRPNGAYLESQQKIVFSYLEDKNQKVYLNSIDLKEGNNQYKLEHGLEGYQYFYEENTYVDNVQLAHISDEIGQVIVFSLRPPDYDFQLQFVSTRIEIVKNYELQNQDFKIIQSQEDHRWTFHPEITLNKNTKNIILSWWEDLSVNYKIYDYNLEEQCTGYIEDSQSPSFTTWGEIGVISYRNSTGNFIEEVNLQDCSRNIDNFQELYKLWGNNTSTIETQLVIQQGHFVTLQVLYPDSFQYSQLSFTFEECPEGCGNCDTKDSCNYCEISRTNYPACDECAIGYINKSNNCFTCQELYGQQCKQCNESGCICEGGDDDCNTCLGKNRNPQLNCECNEGFLEDIFTKECEFIPCQVGYYQYNYKCEQCYQIKGDDSCYHFSCPMFYKENENNPYECVEYEKSILFMILFLILALIIICVSIFFVIKKRKQQKKLQKEEEDRRYNQQVNEESKHSSPLKNKRSRLQSIDMNYNIEMQSQEQNKQDQLQLNINDQQLQINTEQQSQQLNTEQQIVQINTEQKIEVQNIEVSENDLNLQQDKQLKQTQENEKQISSKNIDLNTIQQQTIEKNTEDNIQRNIRPKQQSLQIQQKRKISSNLQQNKQQQHLIKSKTIQIDDIQNKQFNKSKKIQQSSLNQQQQNVQNEQNIPQENLKINNLFNQN